MRDQSCMPVPAAAAQAVIAEAEAAVRAAEQALGTPAARPAVLAAAAGGSLADCFAAVPDPRDPRGVRHSLACVLFLVTAALLSGKTLLEDVTAWTARASPEVLAAAGARRGRNGTLVPPHPRTVTRVLGLLGAQALADAAAGFLAAALPPGPVLFPVAGPVLHPSLNCDGKEVRGAAAPDGTVPFLLSAAAGGTVIAERQIGAKTNEIPEIGPMLLDLNTRFPLAGRVITADALHTQRKLADLICRDLLAHYVLTVKKNQKNLHAALAGLNWDRARRHVARDTGHGRDETRTCQVLTVPARIRVEFPHARQAARITRTVTRLARRRNGKTWEHALQTTTETVYVITSLSAREAAPAQSPPTCAATGPSRTRSTGSATSPSARTPAKSGPAQGPASWPRSATSPSASSARPATPASPPPSARPNTTKPCSSPYSASPRPHDQPK